MKTNLEVISRLPSKPRRAPPILFVHGAWHGAWCWDEHFLSFFADQGFASYAVSLRGHGDSPAGKSFRLVRVRDYVDDVAQVAAELGAPPILVGHSSGGFVVQKYLEAHTAPFAILLASVPPSGVLRAFLRAARGQPLDVLRCNLTLSLWPIISTPERAKRNLFSESFPKETLERLHKRLQDEPWVGYLDTLAFNLVRKSRITTPMIVMGAADDGMVSQDDVRGTARAFGVEPLICDGLAHDMMLDSNWRVAAETMLKCIEERLDAVPAAPKVAAAA